MVQKIRIIEIEIENYRQYVNKQVIEFSNRENGFSVIIGENGSGKSNILNAINWCFYKTEPHQDKNEGAYIINQKYFEGLEKGKDGVMSVKIKIQIDSEEFHISRILTVTKNEFQYEQSGKKSLSVGTIGGYLLPKGTIVQETNSTFEILKKGEKDTNFKKIEDRTETVMNEILPKVLSPYFLLDGEYLKTFWDDLKKVKTGIEQISQLHLLDKASVHLSQFKTIIPKIGSGEIDSKTNEINGKEYWLDSCDSKGSKAWSREMRFNYDPKIHEYQNYHLTGRLRLEEIEEDIEKMDLELQEISKKYRDSNIQIVRENAEAEQKLKTAFEKHEPIIKQARKDFIHSQIHNGPIFFLESVLRKTVEKADALRKKGDLPYAAKMLFTKERLEMNRCICESDLTSKLDSKDEETNRFRKNVEKIRDELQQDEGLDYALELSSSFKNLILNEPEKFIKEKFEIMEDEYERIRKISKKINVDLEEIRLKITNAGAPDYEQITIDHDHITKTLRDAIEQKKDIEFEIMKKIKEISLLRIEHGKLLRKDKRTKKLAIQQDIWLKITKITEDALSSLKEDIRTEVQDLTFKIFTETMYKKKTWESFTIDEKYFAQLFDTHLVSKLGSISAGERLFLTLSFISALKEITGYKFPLIIDTPLGRVSSKGRYLLSQALPRFLPEEQLIFLATDTEFLQPILEWDRDDPNKLGLPEQPFAQLLEGSIKMNYWSIRPAIDEFTSTIHHYTPLWRQNNAS